MTPELEQLQQWLDEGQYIVFFGGAGVSTESGIPDFRSVDGLYHQSYDQPPETILSHTYFQSHPREFYRFYREKMLCLGARPNPAHRKLAELEAAGRLKAVITQNIDGLHQAAGSREVLELHGSIYRNYCCKCKKPYSVDAVLNGDDVPRCSCGGVIKPDVVLYEESLDSETLARSVEHLRRADVLIVGGTSLAVYPAAGLVQYYRGSRLAVLNMSPTPLDSQADLVIAQPIGQVLGQMRV